MGAEENNFKEKGDKNLVKLNRRKIYYEEIYSKY
jgi:hypothetical protein